MIRRWPWLVVAALLAMVACRPGPPPTRLYDEDFETLCDGAPCGWERTHGDATQAIWVETIHAGEHGLRLDGQVSVRGTRSGAPADPVPVETLSVELTACCDIGNELRVDLVLIDEHGGTFTASAFAMPAREWSPPLGAPIVSRGGLAEVAGVMAVAITKTGPGACEISELAIDSIPLPVGC